MNGMALNEGPSDRAVRVLLAKAGLDGHDRGVKVVTAILRDAGMEVIYLGLHQTTEAIVTAAIQEDVDVIGLSSLGGTHLVNSRELLNLLAENDCDHIPVVVGGTIPVEDIPALEALGIKSVLRPGSQREEIVSIIDDLAQASRAAMS